MDVKPLVKAVMARNHQVLQETMADVENAHAMWAPPGKALPLGALYIHILTGEDFFVSFSPERVKANLVFAKLRTTPKIVGGVNSASAAKAEAFYRDWKIGTVRTALARQGLAPETWLDPVFLPPATRRRATFAAFEIEAVDTTYTIGAASGGTQSVGEVLISKPGARRDLFSR